MKNIIKLTTMSLIMLFAAMAASAQTPYSTTGNSDANAGSIDLSITVAKSADLRKGGGTAANEGKYGVSITSSADNDALNTTLVFNNVTPSSTAVSPTNDFSYGQIQLQARSNAPTLIKAFVENAGANGIPSGAGNSGDFKLGDIGFGKNSPSQFQRDSGGSLLTGSKINMSGSFNSVPTSAAVINGQPQYTATLDDLGTTSAGAVQIAGSNRISKRGDNTSANWQAIRVRFSVRPQYYTASQNPLTATVKFFIVTP